MQLLDLTFRDAKQQQQDSLATTKSECTGEREQGRQEEEEEGFAQNMISIHNSAQATQCYAIVHLDGVAQAEVTDYCD